MTAAAFTARAGDFDFLVGRWRVTNRRLRHRHVGSDDWDEFVADYEAWTHLDGALSVDEFRFVERGTSACAVRTLDRERGCWSIYWITSTAGRLGEPVHGGWSGDRGEFYGDDSDGGMPIRARFLWTRVGPDAARWEQAFRRADTDQWETNWTMDFRRPAGA